MRNTILSLSLFILTLSNSLYGQINIKQSEEHSPTSIGLIIYSNDTETVWNALRFANYAKSEGDTVCVFLLGKGVEVEKLTEQSKDVKEQIDIFLQEGGKILGCGTCLQSRNSNEPKVCKFSSMADLYELIRKSKVVLTF